MPVTSFLISGCDVIEFDKIRSWMIARELARKTALACRDTDSRLSTVAKSAVF